MDKGVAAQPDADMVAGIAVADSVEADDVAGAQLGGIGQRKKLFAGADELCGVAQGNAYRLEAVEHQSAAVEACRTGCTENIGRIKMGQRVHGDLLAAGQTGKQCDGEQQQHGQ